MNSTRYETIIVEMANQIGIITLNRPDTLNAINEQMSRELRQALSRMEEDGDIRVIVLKGAGDRAFCAGADIKESRRRELQQQTKFLKGLIALTRQLENIPKPIIAAVNGYAFGGGFELILSCDFVIATKDSSFSSPEINIGIIPAAGGTQRLPRLIGKAKAKELLFTGKSITATEAKEIGLINKVVSSKEELIEACLVLASELAEKAPLALMQLKHLVNKGVEMPLDLALDFSYEAFTLLSVSEDRTEGQKAFIEKRKPRFKGK
ncbi:enoyl-CoA hydratase/isomerase family protein [Chloroflexota bacterium]